MNWSAGFQRVKIGGVLLVLIGVFSWILFLISRQEIASFADVGKVFFIIGWILFVSGWIGEGFACPKSGDPA